MPYVDPYDPGWAALGVQALDLTARWLVPSPGPLRPCPEVGPAASCPEPEPAPPCPVCVCPSLGPAESAAARAAERVALLEEALVLERRRLAGAGGVGALSLVGWAGRRALGAARQRRRLPRRQKVEAPEEGQGSSSSEPFSDGAVAAARRRARALR